jgi:hypothetical protein
MRERDATQAGADEVPAPARREDATGLRALAARMGNSAFRLARTAPGGVAHPGVRALTAARRHGLMRTPLADAVHAAGSGPQTAAFALLAGLSASATSNKLRPLTGPDLVTLRTHLGDAPAADRARIATALDALLLWSDTETAAIRAAYAGTGAAYSVTLTGDVRQTHAYALWRARAVQALKSKPAAEKTAGNAWLAAHEAHEQWSVRGSGTEPPAAGALPAAFATIGAPPTPSMRPVHKYDVTLPGATTSISYRDDPVAPAYQYLISETGVGRGGTKLSSRTDAAAIFTAAGIADATAQKVMTKVSTLEGGLEAVNTYDTGFISIGFIQFTSGETGTGSLARVLREMKTSDPAAFGTTFHAMGIDVDTAGLTVVDPATGSILRGEAAVRAVMDDKRLTAVFQRAGSDSRAFQAAQVKRAHDEYYLAPQSFTVTQGAVTITGGYGDVLTSEAGKAAIMDRAVQRGVGNAKNTFRTAAKSVITHHGAQTVADLARWEREIVGQLVNRLDVLHAADLSQPPATPAAAPAPAPVP